MLEHENIVKLIGYGKVDEKMFLEYLPKKLDHDAIEKLNWAHTLEILIQSAKALSYIHGHKCVLADFKVDNLMQDKNRKVVKLIDFGAMVEQGKMITASTNGYAPHEFPSRDCATDRWDIYSFGIVMLQLIMKSGVGMPWKGKKRPNLKIKVDLKNEEIHISQRAHHLFEKKNNVVHAKLMEGLKQQKAEQLSRLALDCSQFEPRARPSIGQVIERPEKINTL